MSEPGQIGLPDSPATQNGRPMRPRLGSVTRNRYCSVWEIGARSYGRARAHGVNRRQFMTRTAALNVALVGVPRVFASPGQLARATRLERVVADARFKESVAFAAAMSAIGTQVSVTDGDLTSLWFDDLARHFAGSSAPIAGLTTPRTALVMTELARGPGVSVLWHADHVAMPDGSLRHEMHGCAELVARAAELCEISGWHEGLGSMLAEAEHFHVGLASNATRVVRAPRAVGCLEETLSSWVLAPRDAVRG